MVSGYELKSDRHDGDGDDDVDEDEAGMRMADAGISAGDGFSYASRERNHCEQASVSLSEPPSSATDE